MKNMKTAVAVTVLAILAACGGGGESGGSTNTPATTPSAGSIGGVAAVGAAISNAQVIAKCVSGPVLQGMTSTYGSFSLPLTTSHVAPCMLQVTGGSPTVTLHGFASVPGNANITPFTDLILSKVLGANPAIRFATFDASTGSLIETGRASATTHVTSLISIVTGLSIVADPFNGDFAVGNGDDHILDVLGTITANAGKTYDDLRQIVSGESGLTSVTSPPPSRGVTPTITVGPPLKPVSPIDVHFICPKYCVNGG